MPFPAPINSNYQSPTGFGGFEVTIHPNGTLDIAVRVDWQFMPGSELLRGHGPDGGDITLQHPWAPGADQQFKATFVANIPQTWNRKWRLRCTHPNYAGTYEPIFHVVDGSPLNHHLEVRVENAHNISYLHGTDGYLQLHKYDNLMFDDIPGSAKTSPNRVGVKRGVMEQLDQLISTAETISLQRTGNASWSAHGADLVTLNTFAHGLIALQPHIGTVPIVISASSGATGKADALVQAVEHALQAGGMNLGLFNIQRDAVKTRRKAKLAWTPPKATANVSIRVDEGTWKFPYRVSDHEFGHCLGLPDEYTLYSPTARIRGAHQQWVNLCQNAGIAPNPIPGAFGQQLYNSSLMSYGWVTCACHYVTIWDAVVQATRVAPFNIQPNQWVIERGTETQNVA